MKLKEYQDCALKEAKGFLERLVAWRKRAAENPDLPKLHSSLRNPSGHGS